MKTLSFFLDSTLLFVAGLAISDGFDLDSKQNYENVGN